MRGGFEGLYRRNWRHVRNQLLALGVPRRDLDDLCHDVFLVTLRRLSELEVAPSVERFWLKQVGEFVVSNYRRRAFRYFERSAPPEELELTLADAGSSDARERADLLQVLLRALPAAESDLLALHLIGELSFRTLSDLCDADRKTLRKQFLRAVRRARLALRDGPSRSVDTYSESVSAAQAWHGTSAPRHCEPCVGSNHSTVGSNELMFNLLAVDDCVAVGLIGPIAITHWYGKVTSASLETVMRSIRGATRGRRFGYFAMVEKCSSPPGFEARRKLLELLRLFRKEVVAHATVTYASSFVQPIMSALVVLARAPFPMRVVRTVADAAEWILETSGNECTGLPDARTLSRAAEELRAIRMAGRRSASAATP